MRRILEAALLEAYLQGCRLFTLDTCEEAIPFFEKQGFKLTNEVIVHADGMKNHRMRRNIE